MENYVRVNQPRPEEETPENEVRITSAGRARNYITFGAELFTDKGHNSITLRAMGKAINKTVAISEILKRRIEGLHQNVSISSQEIIDVWEPKDGTQGLDRIETSRHASVLVITLSKSALDTKSAGYQEPLPASEVKPLEDEMAIAGEADGDGEGRPRRSGGRGRGRGGRRSNHQAAGAGEEKEGAAEGGEVKERRARRSRGGRGRNGPRAAQGDGAKGADAPAAAPVEG